MDMHPDPDPKLYGRSTVAHTMFLLLMSPMLKRRARTDRASAVAGVGRTGLKTISDCLRDSSF